LTKCCGLVREKDASSTATDSAALKKERQYINQYGLSRQAIFNAVDASLERLNTSYIDVLQIHRLDQDVSPEEIMKALHDLVQSRKVRYIGACSMRTWELAMLQNIAEKNGWTQFIAMQSEYSLLYREEVRMIYIFNCLCWHFPEEREMIPYCSYNGIGTIPWGPLAYGRLCRPFGSKTTRSESWDPDFEKEATEADKTIISRVEKVAKKHGKSMAQVSLAWTSSKCTSPIVGISSVKRLNENILGDFALSEQDKKYLEEPCVRSILQVTTPMLKIFFSYVPVPVVHHK
jgi:aryl-alcohol dehydrogenase-like predicted oxidoreductase